MAETGSAPCMGCTDRTEGCHGSCERFRAYRKHYDRMAEKRIRDREADNLIHDGVRKRIKQYTR